MTATDIKYAGNIKAEVAIQRITELGWRELDGRNPKLRVFQAEKDIGQPEKKLFQVNIPTSKLSDYDLCMYLVVKELADYLDCPIAELLIELVHESKPITCYSDNHVPDYTVPATDVFISPKGFLRGFCSKHCRTAKELGYSRVKNAKIEHGCIRVFPLATDPIPTVKQAMETE